MIEQAKQLRHSRVVRSLRDFLTGLGLFALIVGGTSYLPSRAPIETVPMFTARAHASSADRYAQPNSLVAAKFDAKSTAQITRAPDDRKTHIILALVFASLVAFNLAFLRHLRRVYASPR
jgi:hypothetical protein